MPPSLIVKQECIDWEETSLHLKLLICTEAVSMHLQIFFCDRNVFEQGQESVTSSLHTSSKNTSVLHNWYLPQKQLLHWARHWAGAQKSSSDLAEAKFTFCSHFECH